MSKQHLDDSEQDHSSSSAEQFSKQEFDHYLSLAERQLDDHLNVVKRYNQKKSKEKKDLAWPGHRKKSKNNYLFYLALISFFLLNYFWIALYFLDDRHTLNAASGLASSSINQINTDILTIMNEQRDYTQAAFNFNRGIDFLQTQNYHDAIRMFEVAKENDPVFLGTYINVAYSNIQVNDLAAALHNLHLAQELYPNQPRLLLLLGITYGIRGDNDTAEFYLDRVIAIAPETDFADKAYRLLADLQKTEIGFYHPGS